VLNAFECQPIPLSRWVDDDVAATAQPLEKPLLASTLVTRSSGSALMCFDTIPFVASLPGALYGDLLGRARWSL
jgi:hypothetical protein